MSKVTVALVSFVAGISSTLLFSMLSGNQRSISAQEPEPGPAMIIVGAEPKVPPLAGVHFNGQVTTTGGVMPLDGIDCEGCTFSGPLFSYAGGAVRLTNPKFSGPVRVNFKGAAANTLALVTFLQALGQNQHPPAFNPNAPIIKRATAKEVFTADFVTPYGQTAK